MRQLASIQRITNISVIENADKIELAQILGWQVVVAKKDNFKINDLIVYLEIDCLCPERLEFEFLRETKFRIKTRKFRKQISQGLIMPLSILPSGIKIEEGLDVSEILNIKNYQKVIEDAEEASLNKFKHRSKVMQYLMGYKAVRSVYFFFNPKQRKEIWPGFIQKSEEERLQVCAKQLMSNFNKDWYISEKIDGSSWTAFLHKTTKFGIFPKWDFGVCSRNIWLKTPTDSNWWKVAKKYDIEKKLRKLGTEIVIQGEVINSNIQKNKYKVTEPDLFIFTIVENGQRVSIDRMKELCQTLELKMVPIINEHFNPLDTFGNITDIPTVVQTMVKMSEGKSKLADIHREGLVMRLIENPNISLKIINPQFLLKYEE